MDHQSRNNILKLKDTQRKQLNTHKEIESTLFQHFQGISEEPIIDRSHFINDFTKHIPRLVTREDNYNLNRPVNEQEVNEVIREMQNGKAHGPNGFNVDFFKECWNIVKQDILDVVDDSRKSKIVLKALNTSFIALIPKQENAMTLDRFIPIALCNVVYKIFSKIIANRLKPLLLTLVSEEQMGYVEGRQILNNIIQAHEMIHSLKSNKQPGMITQLHLEKAYDKLSWAYIREVLKAYGFNHNWIRWVMALVSTSSFSILLNSSPSKTFKPTRGLRQGYLLSPFLFILMMEGLGNAIKDAIVEGKIQGLKLIMNGDALTHQQFVDDTMLHGTPTIKEALASKQILKDFALAAGRLVHTKSILQTIPIFMFSALLTPKEVMQCIRNIQRDFLWGRGEEKKKWALVACEKICKPKTHGGLGLDDLEILNKVLGAKLWWRWLKESDAPWAKVLKQKYPNNWQERELIRMSGIIKGSHIWNKAWENRAIVQKHSFWEIRDGNLA
eukprot:PITA_32768